VVPENIEVGDIARVVKDGKIKYGTFTGRVSRHRDDKGRYPWLFADNEGDEFSIAVDSQGIPVEDTKFTGYYSVNRPDDWYETDEDFEPSQENELLDLAEATNYALRKQYSIFGDDWLESKRYTEKSHRVSVLRGYGSANASELVAALTEIIQAEEAHKAAILPQVYDVHPVFVETYLSVYNPNPEAREIIIEKIPELKDKI